MSATILNIGGYRQASRDALEKVVQRFALIEQALDLQPGSLVQGLLEYFSSGTAEEVIGHITDGYVLKDVPEDWEERVKAIIENEGQ